MKTKLLFTLCFLMMSFLKAQIITTVVGTGANGFGGDGGSAGSAKLYWPWGGTIDAAGNMYISDIMNNRIRKVNTSGIISTVVGNGVVGYTGDGGPATAAGINIKAADANINACDIAFDAAGNMYINDFGNNVIRKINTQGIISTFAGTGVAGYNGDGIQATSAQLNGTSSVSFYQGNLYIADAYNNRVRKVNPSGVISTVAGTGNSSYTGDGDLLLMLNWEASVQ